MRYAPPDEFWLRLNTALNTAIFILLIIFVRQTNTVRAELRAASTTIENHITAHEEETESHIGRTAGGQPGI
jgi:hypothetical protein